MNAASRTIQTPPPPAVNPYRRIGLRGNPFQVINDPQVLRKIVDPQVVEMAAAICTGEDSRIEIIGQRGWGKSTLLGLIQDQVLRQSGSAWAASYVAPEQHRVTCPNPDTPGWLIDEAQRLRPACLRSIFRSSAGRNQRLVLGTHASASGFAGQVGFQIRTIRLAEATLDQVQIMFKRRVAAFAVDPVSSALSTEAAERAWAFAGGNRRTFELLMYELFCSFARVGSLPTVISAAEIEVVRDNHAWS